MADVTIKTGDRLPELARQFLLDDVPINLGISPTITFDMWRASTMAQVITAGSASVVDSATGQVKYSWTSQDALLAAGLYIATFKATISGREMTAPNNGYIVVEFVSDTGASWSFHGDPETRPIDQVRVLSGDTDQSAAVTQSDATIRWYLTEWGNDPYRAAAAVCESMAAGYASVADGSKSVGDLSISTQHGAAVTTLQAKAKALRQMSMDRYPPTPTISSDAVGNFEFYTGMDRNQTDAINDEPLTY